MRTFIKILFFLILILNSFFLIGQVTIKNNVISVDSKKIEKAYGIAKKYAFDGKRDTARRICYKILQYKSDYNDVKILLGRTYAWDNKFDSARTIFRGLLTKKSVQKEAIDGMIDVETWDHNSDSALYYCYYGLAKCKKDSNDFLLRIAKVYMNDGDNDGAKKQINIVLSKDSVNRDAHNMLAMLDSLKLPNKLQLEYVHEWFNTPYPRRFDLYSLSYEKQTKLGPVIGRVYYGHMLNSDALINGLQFEISAYPKISKDYYGFFLLTVSPDYFFARYRIGAEIFRKLPWNSELSVGYRKMRFDGSTFINNVNVYTASLSKYFDNLWISFRPFITVSDVSTGYTYTFEARKFYQTRDNYIFAQISIGSSPDEPANLVHRPISEMDYTLTSNKLKIGFQKPYSKNWVLYCALGFETEEYIPQNFHTVYSIEVRLGYYFR